MSKFVRIIVTLLALGAVGFICFFALIIFGFAGEEFYMMLVLGLFFVMLAFIPMTVFRAFGLRTRKVLWLSLCAVVVVSCVTRESIRAYHDSFERVGDTQVDLTAYLPFGDDTKAVRLDGEPALQLTDSLPRLDGATAFYPVYAAFAQAVYPEKEYPLYEGEVVCSTTSGAYDALVQGEADMIFVLRPSEEQVGYAWQEGVEMHFTPIGREAFVFFVNADNPVRGLTTEQIKGIYSGRITSWNDIGGKGRKIRAFQREVGSGSQTVFLDFMAGTEVMDAPQEDVVQGMGGIIDRTARYTNYPNAIGYTFRFYAESMVGNGSIRLLAVDGIYPTTETITDGTYPLSYEFYAVTRADNANPNVGRLLDWILSEQGQSIVRMTGYNPIF